MWLFIIKFLPKLIMLFTFALSLILISTAIIPIKGSDDELEPTSTAISLDNLKTIVQFDDLPEPSADLESLRESHVTDSFVQLSDAEESTISQLELIPFIDCVSRATGKRFPTIDDVLVKLESYTLSQFIDEMFSCLQSKRFSSDHKLNKKQSRLLGLLTNSGFRPEERPKEEQPDREDVEAVDGRPKKPSKIEKPEETGKPGKIERPGESLIIPKPDKERGDGRIEIFFVRLRWVLWQYLRQLKKQGSRRLQSPESRTIFWHNDPAYIRRRGYRVTRLPVVAEIDCILFDVNCNTIIMDSNVPIAAASIPIRVHSHLPSSHALDHKFVPIATVSYDTHHDDNDHDNDDDDLDGNSLFVSDADNLGELIADGIEDVAKTVYRFSGGFRRVQRHFNRFVNSGADLILG